MLTIYAYKNCDTCRKALKWLRERGIAHDVKAIREHPPAPEEIALAIAAAGGNLRPLFNTSGADYRELGLKDRLPAMSEAEAIAMLSANGNLVKRPFAIGEGIVLTGFQEAEWQRALC